MTDIPRALSEEIVCPDDVVITQDEDGTVHFLAYAGARQDGRYLILKHLVLRGEHAEIFAEGGQGDDSSMRVSVTVEPEEIQMDELTGDDLTTCYCGARRMPSGWCTSGHSPRNAESRT